jgi:hypothetical protein
VDTSGTRALVLDEESPADPEARRAAWRRSPLVRAALALAGTDGEGGFATALDMATMDLTGTQLVVLSACDSARGDARLGQGVYGLRRALFAAGAETVVSSLWQVDDEATRDLMTAYYRNLLGGQGRSDAMRLAAKAVRAEHPHPYYWAPFIVIGEWDHLEGSSDGAIPPFQPQRPGIVVRPAHPLEPIIIGPR